MVLQAVTLRPVVGFAENNVPFGFQTEKRRPSGPEGPLSVTFAVVSAIYCPGGAHYVLVSYALWQYIARRARCEGL